VLLVLLVLRLTGVVNPLLPEAVRPHLPSVAPAGS